MAGPTLCPPDRPQRPGSQSPSHSVLPEKAGKCGAPSSDCAQIANSKPGTPWQNAPCACPTAAQTNPHSCGFGRHTRSLVHAQVGDGALWAQSRCQLAALLAGGPRGAGTHVSSLPAPRGRLTPGVALGPLCWGRCRSCRFGVRMWMSSFSAHLVLLVRQVGTCLLLCPLSERAGTALLWTVWLFCEWGLDSLTLCG